MKFVIFLTLLAATTSISSQSLPNDIVFAGNDRIYVVDANGTGQTAITGPALGTDHPRWSRNGRQIIFLTGFPCSFTPSGISKMNADGSNLTGVELSLSKYAPSEAVFSPNADRIAYGGLDCFDLDPTILVANADGSNGVFATLGGGGQLYYSLDWSPTGERLLYSELPNPVRIKSVNTDGSGAIGLTTPVQGNNFDQVWSPDGSKIAFVSDRDGNWEIYAMNSDGSNQLRITNSLAGDLSPTWSPDGTKLAFSSNRNGPYNIYVMNTDGTDLVQITHNQFDSVSPHWNPSADRNRPSPFDFDGDGRSDVSVFRPSDSTWYLNRSKEGFLATQFGLATDNLVPGDYDGDGKTDIAVYRDGTWWIRKSSTDTVETHSFGLNDDVPVPADYTGDDQDELAVYRNGRWWMLDVSNGESSFIDFGLPDDKPVPADYDGDGKADIAIFRPSDGSWWIKRTTGGLFSTSFGVETDKAVPGDYTGDGKTDIAVWRQSDGTWYVLRSEDQSYYSVLWGLDGDLPAPDDYDGDGRWDVAVWRPSSGTWYINRTSGTPLITTFGLLGDRPIPNTFVP